MWVQRSTPSAGATPSPAGPVVKRPHQSPSEPICLDSLDEELPAPSLDSISHALAILGNAAKGLAQGDSPPSPDAPKPPSSLMSSPLLQQQKKLSVSSAPGTPLYMSTSSPSGPMSRTITASPQASGRGPGADGMGAGKGTPQAHRHSVLNTQRPVSVGVAKANMSAAASPKPRPPPTASPLVDPGGPHSGLLKGSNNKGGETLLLTSPSSRSHSLQSPTPHLKPYTPPRLPHAPQSNFITPMHATLTKSSHSSIPPIVKLSSRAPSPAVSTPSPSVPQPPRSQPAPSIHQYSVKTSAAFRPPFSGATGAAAKAGAGSFSVPGQKTASSCSSLISSSSINKHIAASASPTAASASPGQRQRPGPGTPQGAKPVTSVPSSSSSPQISQVCTGKTHVIGVTHIFNSLFIVRVQLHVYGLL